MTGIAVSRQELPDEYEYGGQMRMYHIARKYGEELNLAISTCNFANNNNAINSLDIVHTQ